MKKRLVSLAVAAAVAVGASTLATAPAGAATPRPAGADAVHVRPNVDPATVIAIIQAAYSAYKTFIQGGQSGQAATSQIIAAINSAKTEIINHIDAVATAQAKACAQEAVVDFPSFDALTPDNQQNFALNVTSCVTLIDSLLSTVVDKAAVDQLGFSADSIGPIALIVRSRTGLSNTTFVPVLIDANQQAVTQLAPVCHSVIQEGRPMSVCVSYNGDSGGPDPLALAQREAGQNTDWAMARSVLPTLTSL